MRLSILLTEEIGVLFLVGFVGFMLVRLDILKERDSEIISWLVAYVMSPCVVITSFEIDYTPDKLKGFLISIAAAVGAQLLFMAGTRILGRILHLTAIERASVIYSNCGNLIVPLVTFVLGEKWLFYACAYMIVSTVFMWTHLESMLNRESEGNSLLKIFLNPNVLAIFAGMLLFLTGFQLPEVLASTIDGLGGAIGPLSMLVVGMLIGNMDLKWVFTRKRPYLISALRLVFFPVIVAVVFGLIARTGIHPHIRYILLVSLLAASAPCAVMVTQLTQIHGGDARYAGVINVMSVIFCIFTMPLMVFLFDFVAG